MGVDKFVVRLLACTLVGVFAMVGGAIVASIFFFGDGEGVRIVENLTPPFIALVGGLASVYLVHNVAGLWPPPGGQAIPPSAPPMPPVTQLTRYDGQQWPLGAPTVPSQAPGAPGPLSTRVAAQGVNLTAQGHTESAGS